MYDVVAFGEAMLRLSPPNYQRFEQTHSFDVTVGGSELNTAVGVCRMGLKTAWVSRLVESPLGRMVANKGREHGVDMSHVVWTNEGRVGVYFLEMGASPRASAVIYDRANSAISQLQPGEVDWSFLEGCRLFHTSGITPALSTNCAKATLEAVQAAKAAGCEVSFDVNYRAKLWSREEAGRCVTELMKYVDVLITTDHDTERVFDLKGTSEEICTELKKRFDLKVVTVTLRDVLTPLTGKWSSIALADTFYRDKQYYVEMIDRVGAGDAYTAGFLYGYLADGPETGVKYGNGLSAINHTIPGDLAWVTRAEVEAQIGGAGSRIQR